MTERLQASSKQKLTLISAPAGFGKTTLAGEWIYQNKRPVAWVSLDAGDNDPARFWSYFIAALQTLQSDLGKHALTMLQSPEPAPFTVILTNLINDIAAFPGSFYLVLDDYQVIRARSIHESLFFFIEHIPAQMHIVILSRSDPSLPLARLRARNQLYEIHSDVLRFTLEETKEFLNQVMELDLSPEDIAALETRTEGWIAGLQLAALSMQGRKDVTDFIHTFSGNHYYIFSYLVEEVFAQRPKGTLDFLLRTSILDRLCAPLCDAILEKQNSIASLEALERANLFLLPLDDQHQWFRYHQLFADILRARLQKTQPGLIPELHRRAAEWFENSNLMEEAIKHALEAQDFPLAAGIIEKIAGPTIVSGQIRTALGWLDSLPAELMNSSPNLCVIHAAALMFTNQLEVAEARLQVAERYIQSLPEKETTKQRAVRGKLEIMRANLARLYGDLETCIDHANRALEVLPESEIYWRASPLVHSASVYLLDGNVGTGREEQAVSAYLAARDSGNLFTHLRSITNLARLRAIQGRLRQAALTYREVLEGSPGGLQRLIGSASYHFGFAYYFGQGSLLYEWNDLKAAEEHLLHGVNLIRETLTADADVITLGYSCLARLRQARGDEAGARAVLEDFSRVVEGQRLLPGLVRGRNAEEARIQLMQGDLAAATLWVERSGLSVKDETLPYPNEVEYLLLARIIISRNQKHPDTSSLQDILALLDRLLQAAGTGSRMGSTIEILSLRALALYTLGNVGEAREAISRALRLAVTEGFLRIFLDQGEAMHRFLLDISAGLGPPQAREYPLDEMAKVLAAFSGEQTAHGQMPKTEASIQCPERAELFTRREMEVLQLVAEGASNQEIAARLSIAGPTVKRHISNIFDKLGVGSRTQAIAQARKLGLLS